MPIHVLLASVEYTCLIGGAKINVMGHLESGVVQCSVDENDASRAVLQNYDCEHVASLLEEVRHSIDVSPPRIGTRFCSDNDLFDRAFSTIRSNAGRTVRGVVHRSRELRRLFDEHELAFIGALFRDRVAKIEMMMNTAKGDSLALLSGGGDEK